MRELMVSFYGTEPAIAAALCMWLAMVAAGAALAVPAIRRLAHPGLLCSGAAVALAAGVWPGWLIARLVRCVLGAEVGAFLPGWSMVLGAAACALPCALPVGFFFPCAAAIAEGRASRKGSGTGTVYLLEAVGSAFAGALLSLILLGRLSPVAILGLASGGLWLAVGLWGVARPAARAALAGVGIGLACAALWAGPLIDGSSARLRWATVTTFDRVASVSTRYQYVELGAREGEFALVRNGRVGEQFPDRAVMRQRAALVLTQHPRPERVLLIGGGLTGLCQALLRAPLERLDYVEPDPRALTFALGLLPVDDRQALEDERFTAVPEDGRSFIRAAVRAGRRYDLICLNVGDPASAAESRFYTAEFLRQVAGCLRPGGVLAVMGITGSPNYLDRGAARNYAACLYRTVRSVFPHIAVSPGQDLCLFACAAPGVLTADSEVLGARFERMGLKPALLRYALAAEAFPAERVADTQRALEGAARDAPVNTDRRPVLFARFLRLQAAYAGAAPSDQRSGPVLTCLAVASAAGVAAMLAWVLVRRRRGGPRRSAPLSSGVAVFTTGAFGLTAELLIVYGYQVTFGYVYRDIALLAGLFMLGLAAGAVLALRARGAMPHRILLFAEIGQACFVLLVTGLAGAPWASPVVFAAAALAAGGLTGIVFPSAAAVALAGGIAPATAAGCLDAADHGGAVLGAATAGLFLLPVLGLGPTAALLALVKGAGLVVLLAGGRLNTAPGLDDPCLPV